MSNEALQLKLQELLTGQFTLERELPRGGMSRVFIATEVALRRRVVMKFLSPELAVTLSAARFKREIAMAARLQHPNIVPLLAAGSAGLHLYYTMPLVDGESLRERMNRERPMAFDDIIRIMEQISHALAYAHAEGVVHRDIKPENVMFFREQATVLDFGIGKAVMSAATAEHEISRITQAGSTLGTPTYVAPEQAAGDPALDHRADLYALGIVAYEMITGHPPFTGRSPQQVLEGHALRAPEPLASRRPDVPPHLAAIVMKCLEKDPVHRPSDGEAIVRALSPATAARAASSGLSLGALGKAPPWLPWALAGVSTLAAVVLAVLYATRAR